MNEILLANIGNRNIKIIGNYNFIDEKGFIKKDLFKKKTKEILENFEEWEDKIKLNILDIFNNFSNFNHIYFIVTNQENNSIQDTLYAGRIVKKLIEKIYNYKNITIKEFSTNPTERKSVFFFYKKIFTEIKEKFKNLKLYLFVSGGVPAMKEGMIWAGFSNDINLSIIEAINGELEESKIENIYLKEIYKNGIKKFINNNDWYGIIKIIENYSFLFGDKINLLNKAKYILYRYNFDFKSANEILTKIDLGLKDKDLFKKIKINNHLNGIIELIQNIEVTYEKGEYTMLLGKIFRLQEALYRYIFENLTGITTEKDENKKFKDFEKYINNNNELKKYLEENNIKYSEPNTFCLVKILSFIKLGNYKSLFNLSKSIEKIKEKRNLSIVAHGWDGISKKDIDGENLIEKINKIKKLLNYDKNIFEDFKNDLLNELI